MAKTLQKTVFSIWEVVSSFNIDDDNPISEPWIADMVISMNNSLIRKAYTERRIDSFLYLTDEPLKVKDFDQSFTIGDIPVENLTDYCYVDLKPLVTGLRGLEIESVNNIAYTYVYSRTSLKKLLRSSSGYYALSKKRYAVMNDKLLFKRADVADSKYISVRAIWNDPRGISSWNEDDPFPTPSERNLEILTVEHILHGLGVPPDLINDAQRTLSQSKADPNETSKAS